MERSQNNSSSDFSPTFYINYSSNTNNQSHAIPVIDHFSNQDMGWPAQSAVIANHQTATPFQDLLAEAIADQSPPHPNNQAHAPFAGSLAQDGTHPHPGITRGQSFPFHQPNFSQVQAFHQNIDLNEEIENHPGIEGNQNPGAGADYPNPFSNEAFNSTRIAISSGIGGNVVQENPENGGRFSHKRPAPEESSGESTPSIGESSRTRSRSEDEEDEEYIESDDSDGHYVIRRVRTGARVINHSGRRGNPSSVVLGLAAPSAAEREQHALRNRIMARARQMAEEDSRIRRHIRLRRAMHPTTRHLRELASADIPEEPQAEPQPPPPPPQPAVIFPYEHQIHPGFLHPSPPPPQMQLPVPPPNFANFANFADNNVHPNFNWTHANFNRHAHARPPYASPAGTTTYTLNGGETVTLPVERSNQRILLPHEMMQRGSLEQMLTNLNVIPNSPGSNIASSSNSNNGSIYPYRHPRPPSHPLQLFPQGNMVDQYGQQLIPVHPQNIALTEAQARANYCLQHLGIPVMSPGHHVPTHQAVPVIPASQTAIPHEIAMRTHVAAQRRARPLFSEVRNALALVRRGGSLQLEDVMIVDGSVVYADGDNHEEMRLDVDEMSYEELLDLEDRIGSVSTGLSDAAIHAHMKHFKYKTVAIGSSSQGHPCCICQEEFMDGEDLGKLECGHDFHYNCIRQWLFQKNNCPICKMPGLHI